MRVSPIVLLCIAGWGCAARPRGTDPGVEAERVAKGLRAARAESRGFVLDEEGRWCRKEFCSACRDSRLPGLVACPNTRKGFTVTDRETGAVLAEQVPCGELWRYRERASSSFCQLCDGKGWVRCEVCGGKRLVLTPVDPETEIESWENGEDRAAIRNP